MRLKNSIDYKRFPEPSRGDWTRFTILVLSAENALQNTLQGIFSKKYPQKYPKNAEWPNKKLLAG
jgi:hypothetical protein